MQAVGLFGMCALARLQPFKINFLKVTINSGYRKLECSLEIEIYRHATEKVWLRRVFEEK